jgi:hypothetical protein
LTSVSTRLANTPWDNTVKIRDAQTGKATLTLNGHSLFINEDGTVNTYDGTPLPEKP